MSRLMGALAADRAGVIGRYPHYFRPNWKRRAQVLLVLVIVLGLLVLSIARLDVSWWRVWNGFGQLGNFVYLMFPPTPGTPEKALVYLRSLGETVAISFLGTFAAAFLALPLGFLAAKNVIANAIFHFLARRSLDTIRGIDTLIWALIWVSVVGLGPFAGILAIMCADMGAFGKLFSEAIETADRKAVEGVVSTGGTPLHGVRFGLLPQVLPVLASQVLYYFESNTRSATIIGIVGAGGIGLHLSEQIRTLEWQHVSFIVILILAAVATIDYISSRLRFAIIGRSASV